MGSGFTVFIVHYLASIQKDLASIPILKRKLQIYCVSNAQVYNMSLLTIVTMLYSRSLEFIHPVLLKFCIL